MMWGWHERRVGENHTARMKRGGVDRVEGSAAERRREAKR